MIPFFFKPEILVLKQKNKKNEKLKHEKQKKKNGFM